MLRKFSDIKHAIYINLDSRFDRRKLFEEQLTAATDSRIRKMRESQINSAENDFQLRLKELSLAKEQCDIVWELIAYGNILVRDIQ
jgi:hypothetical protein